MKNRILFFCTTSSSIGGVETWLDRACSHLGENGFDPVVALVRGMKCNIPERFREHHPNLNTVEVDGRGLNREGRIRAAMRCIRKVRPRMVLPLGVLDANDAVIRLKTNGDDLRFVGRAQGNLPPMLADLEDYRDSIDYVVCPGALTKRYLTEVAGFDDKRVRHIPNGSDRATSKRVPREPGAPLRLGYVGRMTSGDKRVLDLPLLCEELDRRKVPYHLTVVGDGPSRSELTTRLGSSADHLEIVGPMPLRDLYSSVYPRLDCLLLFSSSEAFGIVLAEAMMNGVVPVTSRYIGFHSERLVVDGKHGFSFPVGDIGAAADQIERLCRDQALLERLSVEGQGHALEKYTWTRSLSEWRTCLEQVGKSPVKQAVSAECERLSGSGRLDRLGISPAATDWVRRLRRSFLGPSVPPGGEEWPLYHRTHSEHRLLAIKQACLLLERKISETGTRTSGNSPVATCQEA